MSDTLEQRVDALERALTDGRTADVEGLPEAAESAERLDELAATVETIDDRVAELEASVQALRGFVGGVDAVDEAVERRANAAIARVERLETELREERVEAGTHQSDPGRSDDDTCAPKRDEHDADGGVRRDVERPAANRAPGDAARSVDHEHGRRAAPGADGAVDAGRNDRESHDTADVGRHAGSNEPPVSTLAAAAADTARTELASEPVVSDDEREASGGSTEADATLAERIRRLL